jgi:segregation and condensation protein B
MAKALKYYGEKIFRLPCVATQCQAENFFHDVIFSALAIQVVGFVNNPGWYVAKAARSYVSLVNRKGMIKGDQSEERIETPLAVVEEVDEIEPGESWELVALAFTLEQRAALIQALLFAQGVPVAVAEIAEATGLNSEEIEEAITHVQESCAALNSGLHVVRVAGKYQLRTKGEFAQFIQRIRAEKPKRLSRPALETLAIIAYRQPITRSDVEKIRGVDCTPTLKTLLDRNLIRITGYHTSVGQPALYGTTDEFLHVFGLDGLSDLPALRDVTLFECDPGEREGEEVLSDEVDEDQGISEAEGQ